MAQSDGGMLEEVVVTARRREESLQSVPVAVTAFSSESLRQKGIVNTEDLVQQTPSLQIRSNGAQRSDGGFFLRGQGSTFGSQPGVISYFNEVPEYRTLLGNNIQFYDLSNIQVLKGPQGTLFGRSTTGGAILLTPQKPTNEFEGWVEGKVGNYGLRQFTGAINIPIIEDVLAFRFAGDSIRRKGFTTSLVTGERSDNKVRDSYRFSLRFTPSDNFENLTIFRGERINENATGLVMRDYDERHPRFQPAVYTATVNAVCGALNPGNPAGVASCAAARIPRIQALITALAAEQARTNVGGRKYLRYNASSADNITHGHVQQVSNVATARLGELAFLGDISVKDIFATNRVLNAYSTREVAGAPLMHANTSNGFDILNGQLVPTQAASRRNFFNNWSNELQISGDSERVDWILGYYHSYSKNPISYPPFFATYNYAFNTTTPIGIGAVQNQLIFNEKSTDRGYFGQATVKVLDNLSLTGGYRWTNFKRSAQTSVPRVTAAGEVPTVLTNAAQVDDSASSYNLTADYQATPDLLVYVAHRKGFKPGGANLAPTNPVPGFVSNFDPETVKDFELGAKYDWRAGSIRGRSNIAVYRSNYSNIQRNETLPAPPTGVITQVANIAKAKIDGVEIENQVLVGDNLTVALNYTYMNARYTEWPGTTVDIAGGIRNKIDTPYVGAPKHQATLNLRYSFLKSDDFGDLALSTNFYYQTASYVDDSSLDFPLPYGKAEAWGQIGLRLDWNNIKGKPVDAALFVTNVTNEVHLVGTGNLSAALGVFGLIYSEPRMGGASLRMRF